MLERLERNWVYGGFLAGILLLVLGPLLMHAWGEAVFATYLCLPAYMLHQFEEYDRDRFLQFVNANVGGGAEVLSRGTAFFVNIVGVWGVIACSLWLATMVDVGFGLIAAYLVLVNAAVHCGPAIAMRRYNPGLVSAVVLFFPVGGYAVYAVQRAGGGTVAMHGLGLAIAVAIHAGLVAHVLRRRAKMRRSSVGVG